MVNELRRKAKKHARLMSEKFKDEINNSIENSRIFDSFDSLKTNRNTWKGYGCNITFRGATTSECVFDVCKDRGDKKVAALNFASFIEPGGGFIRGAMAQEEAICHDSTLYNVLKTFNDNFYETNLTHQNYGLYTNRAIYSPDIVFYNESSDDSVSCDIITCAAPFFYRFNVANDVRFDLYMNTFISRIRFVLDIAKEMKVNKLILGAYGCGAFGNDVSITASIFMILLTEFYQDTFEEIIFAIPSLDPYRRTLAEFKNILYLWNTSNLVKPVPELALETNAVAITREEYINDCYRSINLVKEYVYGIYNEEE